MRKRFLIFLMVFFIFTPQWSVAKEFSLDKIIKARPPKDQRVFDYAGLLQFSAENKEESLKFFSEKYGVDMILVTVPQLAGQDILSVATTLFTNWQIGADLGGRGILILLADAEKQIKVEVGLDAETVYTDLFCGYIERKQLKPYFENNQVDIGLSAMMEEFIGRAEGQLTDDHIKQKIQGYLSGGGGIKKDIKIGELTSRLSAESKVKNYFSAQATAHKLAKRWVESLRQCVNDPFVSMYTEKSQVLYAHRPKMSLELCQSQYRLYSQPWEIREKQGHAVLLYPNGKKQGPVFMKNTDLGWQIDIWSTANWVRYDFKNEWFLGGRNHPYAFAFKTKPYSSYVYDRNYHDDYFWFSPIRNNFQASLQFLNEKRKADPDNFEVLIQLAELYFDLKIAQKAMPLLKMVIALNPQDARAYRYIGLLNRDYFVSTQTAINYLKKYVNHAPKDPNGYHYLAVAYWRQGRKNNRKPYIKAARMMQKYTDLSGRYHYGYKWIGYFYYKAGKYSHAEKWFKRLLALAPSHSYALRMIQKIKTRKK